MLDSLVVLHGSGELTMMAYLTQVLVSLGAVAGVALLVYAALGALDTIRSARPD